MEMVQVLYSTILMLDTFNMGMVQDLYTTEFSMGMVQDLCSTILMLNTFNERSRNL